MASGHLNNKFNDDMQFCRTSVPSVPSAHSFYSVSSVHSTHSIPSVPSVPIDPRVLRIPWKLLVILRAPSFLKVPSVSQPSEGYF